MIKQLLQRLRLRFGLRARKWPMATPNRRPEPRFRPIRRSDDLVYLELRRAR